MKPFHIQFRISTKSSTTIFAECGVRGSDLHTSDRFWSMSCGTGPKPFLRDRLVATPGFESRCALGLVSCGQVTRRDGAPGHRVAYGAYPGGHLLGNMPCRPAHGGMRHLSGWQLSRTSSDLGRISRLSGVRALLVMWYGASARVS